jgi:hypothetical protein
MLSKDELTNGRTFILRLWDAEGKPTHWIESLRGDVARRWFEIYATSNWQALRLEAADTFHREVSEAEAEATRTTRGQRCVLIHTRSVRPNELTARRETQ